MHLGTKHIVGRVKMPGISCFFFQCHASPWSTRQIEKLHKHTDMSSFSVLNSVILTENEELHRCVPLSTQHHIFQVWFNMSRHTPVVVPCDLDGTLWNNVNLDDFPPTQFWQSGGRHESSWGFTYWGVDWFIHIIYSYFIHIFIHIYI